jgi:AraC family transcriptional regulator
VEGIDENPTLPCCHGWSASWTCGTRRWPIAYDFTVEDHEGIPSMRARLAGSGSVFLGEVRDACDRRALDETFVDATGESPLFFTYGGMIAHVLTYAAYRRTLVTGALYTAGITEIQDDPLAWEPVRPTAP